MNKRTLFAGGICFVILGGIGLQFVPKHRMKTRVSPEIRRGWVAKIEEQRQKRDSALMAARRYKANGDTKNATSAYHDVINIGLDTPEVNREMGDMLLEKGLFKEAEAAYVAGAKAVLDPKRGYGHEHVVLFRLAALYAQTGKLELALQWARTAMDTRYPDTNDSPFRQKNLPPDVIPKLPDFRPVAEDMPNLRAFAHAQIAKEFAFYAVPEHDAFALSEYRKSVRLDPDSLWQMESWHRIGQFLLEKRDGVAAKEAYTNGARLARLDGNKHSAALCRIGLERVEGLTTWNKYPSEKPFKLAQTPDSNLAKPQPK